MDTPPARLLLLEDSDIDADLLLEYLRRSGGRYNVERALRRSDFETALTGTPPDLVLADYSLPDFDGLTALELSRKAWPQVPFVFVSGVLGEDVALRAMHLGATDYVLKRNLARLGAAVERALAEARERRTRERAEVLFRLASSAAGIGVWELDVERQVLHLDDGMRGVIGIGPEEQQPLPEVVAQVVHPDDRDAVHGHLQRAGRADGPADFEYTHRMLDRHSGAVRWLGVKGSRVIGSDGRPRLVGTARDVTDEKLRDAAWQRANDTLEEQVAERTRERDRLWNLTADLMHVCRADGTLIEVNPAWTRLLGRRAADLVGTRLDTWAHPEDREATRRELAAVVQRGSAPSFENRMLHAGGAVRWVRWSMTSERGLVFATGRDVTEERAALEELAVANRRLRAEMNERGRIEAKLQQVQRLEAVGQLTSGVAHDFNNLLAVVLSNINLIRILLGRHEGPLDARVLQRLQSMQNAAERGGKLIAQLLAFSRRQRLDPDVIDVNAVLHGMRDLLQSTLGATTEIHTDLQQHLWRALADPTQLELIVLNLAINARDAMPLGGALTIRTRNVTVTERPTRAEEPEPGSYVCLTVSDAGTGIAPEVLDRMFEPFFTTKDVGKGSGLGLAQVYGFAKQSGGGVRVETTVGAGTSVHVYVPQAQEAAASEALAAVAPAGTGRARGVKLLVVDDDDEVRDATAHLLIEFGYEVVQASGGAQALERLEAATDAEPFDLVIADFAMPGMTGAELRRRIVQQWPDLPVAIATGYADLSALHDVPEDMVLHKPLDFDVLVARLTAWAANDALPATGSRPAAAHEGQPRSSAAGD